MLVEHTMMSTPSTINPVNGKQVERVIIPTTKRGKPAYWESGGATTNTGSAVIVTDRHYQKLVPLYINRKGSLSNANHALMPLNIGYKIIKVCHHREDFDITVFEVVKVSGERANLEIIASYSQSEQRDYEGGLATDAINAGIAKATKYHCREPYYIQKNEN